MPWPNCCAVPQTGVFAEERAENHPLNCIWYAVWFCTCMLLLEYNHSLLGHTIGQLFAWPSSPTKTNKNLLSSFVTGGGGVARHPFIIVIRRISVHVPQSVDSQSPVSVSPTCGSLTMLIRRLRSLHDVGACRNLACFRAVGDHQRRHAAFGTAKPDAKWD